MPAPQPGSQFLRSGYYRNIHWNLQHVPVYIGGVIDATSAIDGSNTGANYMLRPGTLLARVTATKLFVPVKRTRANGSQGGGGGTELTVDNAAFFKAGDAIKIGSTDATILSVDYTTNKITLTAGKTWSDNDPVIGAADGSEKAVAVLDEFVNLVDPETGVPRNMQFGKGCIKGYIKTSMIVGDIDSVRASGVVNELDDIVLDEDVPYAAVPPQTTTAPPTTTATPSSTSETSTTEEL